MKQHAPLLQTLPKNRIKEIVSSFYDVVFNDVLIGHFFVNTDKNELVGQQVDFLIGIFGGPKNYQGRKLDQVHRSFSIKNVHFDRRQVILKDILEQHFDQKDPMIEQWLALENRFRKLIVNDNAGCR